jgi:hypothetical protein
MRWYSTSEAGADMIFLILIGYWKLVNIVRSKGRVHGRLIREGCESKLVSPTWEVIPQTVTWLTLFNYRSIKSLYDQNLWKKLQLPRVRKGGYCRLVVMRIGGSHDLLVLASRRILVHFIQLCCLVYHNSSM